MESLDEQSRYEAGVLGRDLDILLVVAALQGIAIHQYSDEIDSIIVREQTNGTG